MKRLLLMLSLGLTLMGCADKNFTTAEREVIHAGEGDVMYVLRTDVERDSLLLRSCSEPISEQIAHDEDFDLLCRRMLATVQDPAHEGVGIAAPQVGVLRRVVAVQRFDKEGEPFEIYLNPEIVEYGGEREAGGEGCLSVPEIYDDVVRWQQIRLRYHDREFIPREETIEGFTAVIFQHELDHLVGKLFVDYLEIEE